MENEITTYDFEPHYAVLNSQLGNFLRDWLQEERLRTIPELKIKDPWLLVDGEHLTHEKSKKIIADWLQTK